MPLIPAGPKSGITILSSAKAKGVIKNEATNHEVVKIEVPNNTFNLLNLNFSIALSLVWFILSH